MFRSDLLRGKRILVTGGGSGLGRIMASHYAQHGACVYICGRRGAILESAAAEMRAEFGADIRSTVCDIKDAARVETMMESIFADGPLDGLVNNAAGQFLSPTKDLSPCGFEAITDIVFEGTFFVTLAVGKRCIASGNRGSIISILTTWVRTGSAFTGPLRHSHQRNCARPVSNRRRVGAAVAGTGGRQRRFIWRHSNATRGRDA